ncbi:MAG: 4-hydroxy-tetrahydrodipicolinate reductase [Spirochaetales bacterium]|nr:4-hydroxy-tetrahydrodipicolinate reductase [Spirochaetales bacterium]
MKVILVGYGNMGREVEKILKERNHTITAKIDTADIEGTADALTESIASQADVAIEFSASHAVLPNAEKYSRLGLNAVVGTTGWYSSIDELKKILDKSSIGYLYGSNFSIGAQLFFKIVAYAARLTEPFPQYDILGYEIHHKRKKDSPSGTAHSIADIILKNNSRKKKIITEKLDRAVKKDELHFASVRGGEIPGIHTVLLDSYADTIQLTHSARNRGGFALGAVLAAEWLQGKSGIYTVNDFIDSILK